MSFAYRKWRFPCKRRLTPHALTRAHISRVWLTIKLQCSLCAMSPKLASPRAHVMFHLLIDPPMTSPSQSTPTSPSLCCFFHTGLARPLSKLDYCSPFLPNSISVHRLWKEAEKRQKTLPGSKTNDVQQAEGETSKKGNGSSTTFCASLCETR